MQLAPDGCAAANPAFDVTPARLVSALITERGVVAARPEALARRWRSRPHDHDDDDEPLREQAVHAMRRLDALGLNRGSTGNLSLRCARDGATAC